MFLKDKPSLSPTGSKRKMGKVKFGLFRKLVLYKLSYFDFTCNNFIILTFMVPSWQNL